MDFHALTLSWTLRSAFELEGGTYTPSSSVYKLETLEPYAGLLLRSPNYFMVIWICSNYIIRLPYYGNLMTKPLNNNPLDPKTLNMPGP